jgi:hypothetical protein
MNAVVDSVGDVHDDDEYRNEDAPLLRPQRSELSDTHHHSIPEAHSPKTIVGILFTTLFILGFGAYLLQVPTIRLYEDIICHHYYNGLKGDQHIGFDQPIDESMCKGDQVQSELNVLEAVYHFISAVPGKLL